MSEYHLRYGGYGGIGYYLVSDMYIALFSRFTTCGSWEGHNILDYLVENDSDVRPDTIHADTQGQSAAIFGLAHLLGIQLQPRFAIGKGSISIAPSCTAIRTHRSSVLETIDWKPRRDHAAEMLRVAVSIGAGRINPRPFSDGWQLIHARANSISPSASWAMQSAHPFYSNIFLMLSCGG